MSRSKLFRWTLSRTTLHAEDLVRNESGGSTKPLKTFKDYAPAP